LPQYVIRAIPTSSRVAVLESDNGPLAQQPIDVAETTDNAPMEYMIEGQEMHRGTSAQVLKVLMESSMSNDNGSPLHSF
jgi:hypothetical protein